MFEVTLVDGNKVEIDEADVIRIQKSHPLMTPDSNSRIDAKLQYDVLEEADAIASIVKAVLKENLATLTLPNKNAFWFFGPAARGPDRVTASQRFQNMRSAVIILKQRMYVANSPEEVAKVLKDAGGQVLPIGSAPADADASVTDWPDQQLE